MEFSDFLTEYRNKEGLTKKEMAQKLGWTPMYYARFENGKVFPTKRNIERFSDALNVELKDISKFIK